MTRRRASPRLSIPRSLRIKGRRWRVRLTGKPKRRDMRGLRGLCDPETRTLWIDRACSREEREVTYLHELLHAMWPARVVSNEVEERIVESMERRLYAVVAQGGFAVSGGRRGRGD